ncbi:MAG: ATP-binding protein [Ruminococcus sp.]|nr:ATP-binding protein [Ruminococcus sp.]MCM1380566.1 ATP-binding protein [Muribaculaceae bacterium]MCM1478945.1 ATP-binding protein [Muribaculaceae bacterium]
MLKEYAEKLQSLAVFRGILREETVAKLLKLLKEPSAETYGEFAAGLYRHGDSLTDFLLDVVTEDENVYMRHIAEFKEIPANIDSAVRNELRFLQELSRLTSEEVWSAAVKGEPFAGWVTSEKDFLQIYRERIAALHTKGFGIFAKYHAFSFKDGILVPIKNPDPQRLSQLSGYGLERGKIIANTLALLNGKPAPNALLYGDAGTGKSSTVKAIVNEYRDRGLRLIELTKAQLGELPTVIEKIAGNPLKFIIFIDDISFSADDDNFSALKAVLEGTSAAKTPNMTIYCTSNRRHLVKESFSDRGDDVHASDTREEQVSLSERFGLRVAFLKPNKDTYLQIVESLAEQYGIECTPDLFTRAEAYALRRSGRSGRAAKHFIELEVSKPGV